METRIMKLSNLLTTYSCNLKKGDKVLIEYEGTATIPLARQLVKDIYKLGAKPFLNGRDSCLQRELLLGTDEEHLRNIYEHELAQMREMDAYIGIRGFDNIFELSDVPPRIMELFYKNYEPVQEYRVNETKWVILRYPNASMAQLAGMSQEGFEEFFFDVCTMDYKRMSDAMNALVDLMNKTDDVHILGPGTDLRFSIKGIPTMKCSGEMNIPDGEVFTAPVRDSANGVIRFNVPSQMQGFTYDDICLRVENGRIVEATANDNARINQLLDTDEGGRYFGEFAFGVNPYILHPMKDILFDEKICGSFHLTPGDAYEQADNGNHSAIHWDLVLIQRPEYGGGEIWFDGVLIRKDGVFVLDELRPLNPENLR